MLLFLLIKFIKIERKTNLLFPKKSLGQNFLKDKNILNHELRTNILVICSRYTIGGSTDIKGFRLFISYFGNKFMKFIFNINCHDFACAYRGYSLNKLGDFNIRNISSRGYSFFMEVVYHLHNKGIFIKEIPFYAKQRSSGKSKIPNIEIFRTLFNIFRLKFLLF